MYSDRYKLGFDGNMYEIAYSDKRGVNQILGDDFQTYLVKTQPNPIKVFKNIEELKNYRCSQVNPYPTVELNGEGEIDCSKETGICYINARKNSKVSMRAPNQCKKKFDRNKAWLR